MMEKDRYSADTWMYGTVLNDFSQMVYDIPMCWKCGNANDSSKTVYRSSVCSFCGTPLHSCRNCCFYAPGHHYDCSETVEEEVTDKETANFCESFSLQATFKASSENSEKNARAAFNSLFGD